MFCSKIKDAGISNNDFYHDKHTSNILHISISYILTFIYKLSRYETIKNSFQPFVDHNTCSMINIIFEKFSDASSVLKKTILKILNQVKPLNAFGYSIIRFQRSITIFVLKARASNIGIRHIMLIKFEQK